MTKKLEELFEMSTNENDDVDELNAPLAHEITKEAYTNLEKIENALPQVRGLEASDIEMDGLAELAQNSYKDLMGLEHRAILILLAFVLLLVYLLGLDL